MWSINYAENFADAYRLFKGSLKKKEPGYGTGSIASDLRLAAFNCLTRGTRSEAALRYLVSQSVIHGEASEEEISASCHLSNFRAAPAELTVSHLLLANQCRLQRRFRRGEAHIAEVIRLRSIAFKGSDVDMAAVWMTLASIKRDQGKFKEANCLCEQSIECLDAHLPNAIGYKEFLIHALEELADLKTLMNKHENAAELRNRAEALRKARLDNFMEPAHLYSEIPVEAEFIKVARARLIAKESNSFVHPGPQ